MRWEQGRAVIDAMLAAGELQRVPPSRDHADDLLDQAAANLVTVDCSTVDRDWWIAWA